MISDSNTSDAPLGIPLRELLANLNEVGRHGEIQDGNTLVLPSDNYVTEVRVRPVDDAHGSPDPIQARISVVSRLNSSLAEALDENEVLMDFNGFASLGCLKNGEHGAAVESALTVYEREGAWASLHRPLIEAAVLYSASGILGAIKRSSADEPAEQGESAWSEPDFMTVESALSGMCVCNADPTGLTAEFSLANGAITAMVGDHDTALYQQMPEKPHPQLGGGLLCQLEMPYCYPDAESLSTVCAELNALEMRTIDQPPHFGAWCEGRLGGNPAYVTFLPNALHGVSQIALNEAIWSLHRAEWAQAQIAELSGDAGVLKPRFSGYS